MNMAHGAEQQKYLDEMVERRGYVLDYHKVLVANDLEIMKVIQRVPEAVYVQERLLDRRTKELLFILSMVVLRLPHHYIQSHIKKAMEVGVSPQEILEAIELAIPEAGLPTFQHGLLAWAEAVGAPRIEPTRPAYGGGRVPPGGEGSSTA
jgi:4-carboxymuconolactone decarboxylase